MDVDKVTLRIEMITLEFGYRRRPVGYNHHDEGVWLQILIATFLVLYDIRTDLNSKFGSDFTCWVGDNQEHFLDSYTIFDNERHQILSVHQDQLHGLNIVNLNHLLIN